MFLVVENPFVRQNCNPKFVSPHIRKTVCLIVAFVCLCMSCSKFKYIDVVVHYCSDLEQLLWPHGAGLSENLNGLSKSLKSCISV